MKFFDDLVWEFAKTKKKEEMEEGEGEGEGEGQGEDDEPKAWEGVYDTFKQLDYDGKYIVRMSISRTILPH